MRSTALEGNGGDSGLQSNDRLALLLPPGWAQAAMTNITAVLLVLALTGLPVASVVCATECQEGPAASDPCHVDMAASDGPMMAAGDSCHNPLISDALYVVEHRGVLGTAVLTAASFPTTPVGARMDAPGLFARVAGTHPHPPPVLRI